MLFHVTITVRMPYDVDPNKVRELGEREHARCGTATPGQVAASMARGRQMGECEYF